MTDISLDLAPVQTGAIPVPRCSVKWRDDFGTHWRCGAPPVEGSTRCKKHDFSRLVPTRAEVEANIGHGCHIFENGRLSLNFRLLGIEEKNGTVLVRVQKKCGGGMQQPVRLVELAAIRKTRWW